MERNHVRLSDLPTLDVGVSDALLHKEGYFSDATVSLDLRRPPYKIHNFVRADACHLPFRDDAFKKCLASHIIEHVKNPYQLLSELIRVSASSILIRTPHRYGAAAKMKQHLWYFSEEWFRKQLRQHENVTFDINTKYQIRRLFFLTRPLEITVRIKKMAI